jgi:hypothetical protein
LETAAASLNACCLGPADAEEVQDLREEAMRIRSKVYEARDRKYHSARAMASRELKAEYVARLNRRPRS